MYSKIVKEYFENPINLGIIEDADAIGIIENEICSDIIKIYIKVDKQSKSIIKDAKFEVKGCPPVIASCCVATEMIKEMNIEKDRTLTIVMGVILVISLILNISNFIALQKGY